ncbi:MAG: amidohydrolase family protein [Verrucomicrobiales bacterium]|nr:amidohydrolase family protein [Verrucomicrobiales bacterium]
MPRSLPELMNRRCFLGSLTAAAGVGSAGCRTVPSGSRVPRIVDTHTHFYDPLRPGGVPWPAEGDRFLYRTVLPSEYERIARPLGIEGTLVVEASHWVSDNDWVLDLARREPFLVGVVGHLQPGGAGFAEDLERLSGNLRFRGIRIGSSEVASACRNAKVLRDLMRVTDAGLVLDVLVGMEQLMNVEELASKLPGQSIVINHCANVHVTGQVPPLAYRELITLCARNPRVYMKVSGLVEGTGRTDGTAPRDVDFYRPLLDTIWNAFGEDRLIFGSNWPVSAQFAPLEVVHGIVAEYFTERGPVAFAKYFGGNAASVYGIVPRSR